MTHGLPKDSPVPHLSVTMLGLQTWTFTGVLGVQTQVLSLVGQMFPRAKAFLSPCFKFLLAFINYTSVTHSPVNNPSHMFLSAMLIRHIGSKKIDSLRGSRPVGDVGDGEEIGSRSITNTHVT